MMKRLILVLAMTLFYFFGNSQDKLLIDKVIAKVGTETILLSDIENQYSFSIQQGGPQDPEIKCQILESLVGQKLIVHHAKLDSLEISNEEIEASLDFRIEQVLRQMNGDEEFFEEYYNMSVLEMRENLRDDLSQQMLAERMQGQIINEVFITPKEVKEFFNQIPVDSLPYLNAEVELSEIVIKPKVNDDENAKALKKIIDIRNKIINGEEEFGKLAQTFSDDPGSGSRGGDLGFAVRGTFVPEFEATAYSLKKGEISEPVLTEFGYHILELLERRGNRIHLRHILVKPEITEIDNDKARESLDTINAKINRNEISFEAAVKRYSEEKIPSYSNNGMLQNPKTGKTTFETADLPWEIYAAIENMEVGDISEPLEYPLPTGEVYYRIIKLRNKTNPHKANLDQDYAKILQFAKESKKSEYFAKWIDEKLKNTFIQVEEGYITCPKLEKLIN